MNELLRRILGLPAQASTIARDVDSLHYFVILTTMAGAAVVTIVGGYFLVRYRSYPGETGHNPHAGAKPFFGFKILALVGLGSLFLVWWVIGVRLYLRIRVAPLDAMPVYVTAKQWMWKFAYPAGAQSIATLVVPAGKAVKLIMTSRDVIHSFYVPDFRVKQDVVPGRYTTLWFAANKPGRYPILCTQYCGTGHSIMRGEVVALAPHDFERWLGGRASLNNAVAGPEYVEPSLGLMGNAEPKEMLSLVREGLRVAGKEGCLRCHSVDGTPHIGPTWAGLWYSEVPLQGGGVVVADEAYLTESMMDPLAKIHRGFPAIMPSYLGQLSPALTAALLEYIKSLRGVRPVPAPEVPLWTFTPTGTPNLGGRGESLPQLPPRSPFDLGSLDGGSP